MINYALFLFFALAHCNAPFEAYEVSSTPNVSSGAASISTSTSTCTSGHVQPSSTKSSPSSQSISGSQALSPTNTQLTCSSVRPSYITVSTTMTVTFTTTAYGTATNNASTSAGSFISPTLPGSSSGSAMTASNLSSPCHNSTTSNMTYHSTGSALSQSTLRPISNSITATLTTGAPVLTSSKTSLSTNAGYTKSATPVSTYALNTNAAHENRFASILLLLGLLPALLSTL